jgi:hypothetical protein
MRKGRHDGVLCGELWLSTLQLLSILQLGLGLNLPLGLRLGLRLRLRLRLLKLGLVSRWLTIRLEPRLGLGLAPGLITGQVASPLRNNVRH